MRISAYEFGKLTVDGLTYGEDVVIHAGRAACVWHDAAHLLTPADLEGLWDKPPSVLVVGTGFYGRLMVPEETKQAARAHGVEIRSAPTKEAIDLFNSLVALPTMKVDAVLHLTC